MKITACVIVKNEEKNILYWLANMQRIADEIVVVDTGSTDRTRDLLREKGIAVYPFTWQGDFAAAKNFALQQAKGEWILFLDADEHFTEASLPWIRPLIQRLHHSFQTVGVMCRLVNIDVDDWNRFKGSTVQIRIFRNAKTIRYEGRVHESLVFPKNKIIELVKKIEIYHTGYSSSIVRGKIERNLELLREKIKQNSGKPRPRDYRYLMDCYYGLGEYAKCIVNARRALEFSQKIRDSLDHIYRVLIQAQCLAKEPFEKVIRTMDQAAAACPDLADFPILKGVYLFGQKDYLTAEDYLRQGLEKNAAYRIDTVGVADNSQRFLPVAYHILGKLAVLQRDYIQAENFFLCGLRSYRYDRGLLDSFCGVLRKQGKEDAEIIQRLNVIYDRTQDAGFLAQTMASRHAGSDYLYYARIAGFAGFDVLDYLSIGRYEAAAEEAGFRLAALYRMGICTAIERKLPETVALRLLLPDAYLEVWHGLMAGKAPENDAIVRAVERMRRSLAKSRNVKDGDQ